MEYIEINRRLRKSHPRLLGDIVQDLKGIGAAVQYDEKSALLRINSLYTASMLLIRCRCTDSGSMSWIVHLSPLPPADVTLVVRMDPENEHPSDYYLLPRFGFDRQRVILRANNGSRIDTFRFDNLDFFKGMATSREIESVA